jgi:DNA phosphorothioation-associated putative methyltransferase
VLNVIEDPSERTQTLHKAAELTKQALIVAVRTDSSLEGAEQFGDGKITVAGTFQKIYDQTEFRDYLTSLLNKRPYLVAPGIAYLFSDSARESHYLATQVFTRRLEYRTDLIEAFAKDRIARQYVKLANRLGRTPLPEEFSALLKAHRPVRITAAHRTSDSRSH